VFDSRERSKGVLQGRAQWLDRSRHVISELILDIQVDAPSADSRGGVSALQSAVTKLASELQVWQKSLRANGKNVPCAG
jgi:hypothetical protein